MSYLQGMVSTAYGQVRLNGYHNIIEHIHVLLKGRETHQSQIRYASECERQLHIPFSISVLASFFAFFYESNVNFVTHSKGTNIFMQIHSPDAGLGSSGASLYGGYM